MIENELKKYLNTIKNDFDFTELKEYTSGEGTQKSSDFTEEFWENITKEFFSTEENYIVRAGSQQYPDFLIINKNELEEKGTSEFKNIFNKKLKKGDVLHKTLMNEAATNKEFNKKLIKFEIKSAKGDVYQCNDSLPDPSDDVIYVFFSQKDQKVFINTSKQMAKAQGNEDYDFLVKKYSEDKKQINEWRTSKKLEWENFGIGSTPRMTYKIFSSFAHVDQTDEIQNEIIEILKEAKVKLK